MIGQFHTIIAGVAYMDGYAKESNVIPTAFVTLLRIKFELSSIRINNDKLNFR